METKPWTTWKFMWKHIPVGALPKYKRVSLLALNVNSVKGKWLWSDSYSYDLDERKGIDLCCISECDMSESYQKINLHIKAYLFIISRFSDISLTKKKNKKQKKKTKNLSSRKWVSLKSKQLKSLQLKQWLARQDSWEELKHLKQIGT